MRAVAQRPGDAQAIEELRVLLALVDGGPGPGPDPVGCAGLTDRTVATAA